MRVGHSMNDDLTNPDRVREGGPRALPRPCASCTVVSAYNNSTQLSILFRKFGMTCGGLSPSAPLEHRGPSQSRAPPLNYEEELVLNFLKTIFTPG